MGKLKQSEEEIIKLGERIVKELNLEPGVDTLGKWMAHYVADLIKKIEKSSSETEKKKNQKECFEIILKLWSNRELLPMASKPLSDMEPLLELIDILKRDDFSYPFWRQFEDIPDNPTWKGFIETVKRNAENIFELCVYSAINKDVLKKNQNWIEEHKSVLSKKEVKLLEHLKYLIEKRDSFIIGFIDSNVKIDINELSEKERYKVIFDKIESDLDEIRNKLEILKDSKLIK